jgi:hypothetical protein
MLVTYHTYIGVGNVHACWAGLEKHAGGPEAEAARILKFEIREYL